MSSFYGFLEEELLEYKLPLIKFTFSCGKARGKTLVRTAIANGDRQEAGVGGMFPYWLLHIMAIRPVTNTTGNLPKLYR